jgi:hypothetical protein
VEKVESSWKILKPDGLLVKLAVENPVGNHGKAENSEDFLYGLIFFNSLHS